MFDLRADSDCQAQKEAIEINKSLTALGDAGALGSFDSRSLHDLGLSWT